MRHKEASDSEKNDDPETLTDPVDPGTPEVLDAPAGFVEEEKSPGAQGELRAEVAPKGVQVGSLIACGQQDLLAFIPCRAHDVSDLQNCLNSILPIAKNASTNVK